jgi:tRNA nucleotidyltransferase (CCA-adding enzyme)
MDDADAFARAVAEARERFDPDEAERRHLQSVADRVLERARQAAADLPVEADVLQVGSTARDTWVSGDHDVDVFVRLPPALDRERLREYGLRVGHATLPEGREEYAEHPYVTGEFDGVDVDVVPCYRLDDASEVRSAVDRTPFHTDYLEQRLDESLAAEVRAAKALLHATGLYGSDLRTRGFGGYLVELLVVEYGGLRALLAAAADWQPPVRVAPGEDAGDEFDADLVVVDPTDPGRNVAAVLDRRNLARLQHHARAVLADPRPERFEPRSPDSPPAARVREWIRDRATTPVALHVGRPDAVEDQLFPQCRRTLGGLVEELDRRGFRVLRSTVLADDEGETGDPDASDPGTGVALLVELAVASLPAVERHRGPPVAARDHAEGFYRKYADRADVAGPFVDGDRYVVERPREFRHAREFLDSPAVFEVGVGPDVEAAMREGYAVLAGEAVADLVDRGFGPALTRHFEPEP